MTHTFSTINAGETHGSKLAAIAITPANPFGWNNPSIPAVVPHP
ncbi:hypothetical protein [Phormidium sp. CCY1219]|nr:hypothetical protein [Phormidium sp. CCY1219]